MYLSNVSQQCYSNSTKPYVCVIALTLLIMLCATLPIAVCNIAINKLPQCYSYIDNMLRLQHCCTSVAMHISGNIGTAYSRLHDLSFPVHQGSWAGPELYLPHSSTMPEAVPSEIDIKDYAHNHMLKLSFMHQTEQVRRTQFRALPVIPSVIPHGSLSLNNPCTTCSFK